MQILKPSKRRTKIIVFTVLGSHCVNCVTESGTLNLVNHLNKEFVFFYSSSQRRIGITMLRNCACFQRQRRGSSFEDSSSCRSSEIERGGEITPNNGSLLKLFTSRTWYRQWRKTGRAISMTKIERSKSISMLCIFIILFSFVISHRCTFRCVNAIVVVTCYALHTSGFADEIYPLRYMCVHVRTVTGSSALALGYF